MKVIVNGKIITENTIETGKVLIFNEKIVDIVEGENFSPKNYSKQYDDFVEIIDAKGLYISPGFIDIHIHGSGGCDTMDGTMESLRTISETICRNGVTSYLPTTMTMSKEEIFKALSCIRNATKEEFKGAKVLGAHMEGPFINPEYKGAQNEAYIAKPSYDFIKNYLDTIKIITFAPELDENLEFAKKVKNNTDIVLSMGHSKASYKEAEEAIEFGVSHATHVYNAMTPLHHRNPGIVGAAFNKPISCEIIADKIHVHEAAINILLKVKEKSDVVLITDCMRAGSLPEGSYDLGGQSVVVDKTSARLLNGTLAGSVLRINEAVRNIYESIELTLNEVVNLASINPAKVIKQDYNKGSIEKGKDADLLIIDEEFNVLLTIVEGKIVFNPNDLCVL